jgi:hypothetical protein
MTSGTSLLIKKKKICISCFRTPEGVRWPRDFTQEQVAGIEAVAQEKFGVKRGR